MCLLTIYMSPLKKCLFKPSAHFSIQLFGVFLFVCLLLSYVSCLYILEIKLLSLTSFTNIFPQSVDCLFILFMVSFVLQKLEFHQVLFVHLCCVSIALGSLCVFITYSSQNKISIAFPAYRLQIHTPSNQVPLSFKRHRMACVLVGIDSDKNRSS